MRDPNGRELIQRTSSMRGAFEAALMARATADGVSSAEALTGAARVVAQAPAKSGLKTVPAWRVTRKEDRRAGGRGR